MEAGLGRIDLWVARVDPRAVEGLRSFLSDDELARAERFRRPRNRDGLIVSRGILRRTLAPYLGLSPAEIRFTYGEHGKPFVDGARFNASDSADLSVIAVGSSGELGVDVERIRPKPHAAKFARRFFSVSEAEAIASARESERDRWFFACWTRKEAHVKALGGGLTIPLKSFAVKCDPASSQPAISAPGWSLISFEPAPGFMGALCAEGDRSPRVVIRTAEQR